MEYLAIPFELREDYLVRCDNMRDSIACSIGLLLSTRIGLMPFLPKFGCDVWELEFGDVDTANKASVRATLRNAIAAYEKRLSDVSVSFASTESTTPRVIGMTVKVTGLFVEGGEQKKFESTFMLG
jgi:phage baseplate assembly protein W